MDEHTDEAVYRLPEYSYGWGHVDCDSALAPSRPLVDYAGGDPDVYRVVRASDESLWLWEHDVETLDWACYQLAQLFYDRAILLQNEEDAKAPKTLWGRPVIVAETAVGTPEGFPHGTVISVDFVTSVAEVKKSFEKFSSALAEAGERLAFHGTWVTRSLKEGTTLLDEDSEKENI